MKLAIGVMGASATPSPEIEQLAFVTGELIAQHGAMLITGATTGLPFAAAKGAKGAGGEVLGFSPAINRAEHLQLGYPTEFHDFIVFTGLSSKGRNLLNIRASHALIFVGGSIGALNEFTIAYDEHKVIGILKGTGGFCDHMEDWMANLAKPNNRSILFYDFQPQRLLQDVWRAVDSRKMELGL